jgi:hypothetical protein
LDRAAILRAGAALFAAAAFAGSADYVVAHPKNDAAPLQPPAGSAVAMRTSSPSAAPSATPAPARTGRATPLPRITAVPGVVATQLPGITYTHVS